MFGTLKPQGCGLTDGQRHDHRRLYCGLCQSLGEGYGQLSRALVSFDAVFLAVLVEGLSAQPAADDACRCPLMPVVFRPTASPDSPAMRFAAAMSLLLADQHLADKALDDSALAGWLRPLGQRPVAAAQETLAQLGLDLSTLDRFEHRQKSTEQRGTTPPAAAAAPTAEALSVIFAAIAALPGVTAPASALAALGCAVGRVIYFVDALEDLESDAVSGSFNPGLDTSGDIDPARVRDCDTQLKAALDEADAIVVAFPWQRHRPLVEDVFRRQRAAASAASAAAATAAEAVAWRRSMSPARRVVWAVATALISALLWLESSSVAFAGSLDVLRRIQDGAGDTGTPPPPPPPPAPDGGGGGGGGCEDFFGCLTCCLDGPSKCEESIGNCGRGCSQCGDACNSCKNCGRGCDSCGQGCQECGGCCQACQNCN
jgi:hypothetical protein